MAVCVENITTMKEPYALTDLCITYKQTSYGTVVYEEPAQ